MNAATAAAAFGPLPVGDRDFRALADLIYAEAGIRLRPAKKALLAGRLSRRVRELGLTSFGDYQAYVMRHPDEWVPLLDRITTNETHFFREPRQFEVLASRILPELVARGEAGLRPRTVRVWSAGCSSGEEPFSIAMLLLDRCPPGWEIDVLGTDLSQRVLAKAQSATWPIAEAANVPPAFLKRYMLRGVRRQEGQMQAEPELRRLVRFERFNLKAERYPAAAPYDLIFCRNVLIYFDPASKAHVLERLLDGLAPGGHFFLGHAETLGPTRVPMRGICPNVYVREGQRP